MDFLKKFEAYATEQGILEKNKKIVVGISGGADSVCLFRCLLALREAYRLELLAVHVNHGIRGESAKEDQLFVEKLCKQSEVRCLSYQIDVPGRARAEKLTLEEAGRIARYEIFQKVKQQYGMDLIAIAHNVNDQAETVLFHMLRGSALKGMTGIRPVRKDYIRPLLFATREQIEEYLKQLGQDYREDESNRSTDYARNKIRLELLPAAGEINPKSVEHIARLAEHFNEIEAFLEETTRTAYKEMVSKRGDSLFLSISGLLRLNRVIVDRLILTVITELSGSKKDISNEHIRKLRELVNQRNGANLDLPYGLCAKREYEEICICKRAGKQPEPEEGVWVNLSEILNPPGEKSGGKDNGQDCETEILLPKGRLTLKVISWDKKFGQIPKNNYTKWMDYDKIKHVVVIRTRKNGDYMTIDAAGHKKKLKEIWINEKLPVRVRDEKLLMAEDGHIIWVLGGRMSEFYKVTEDTKRVLVCNFYTGENGGNDGRGYTCDDSGTGTDRKNP